MPILHQPSRAVRPRPDWPPSAGIVELELAPSVRPAWIDQETRLRIPVPNATPRQLSPMDDVLVWGGVEDRQRFPLMVSHKRGLLLAYSWEEWSRHIHTEQYASWRRRPLFTRLPVSYQIVPAGWRHRLAMRMCQSRSAERFEFPSPLFDGGFEALCHVVRLYRHGAHRMTPAPRVCLTHDVDTAEGFRSVQELARLELSLGLRSSWNFVVDEYPIDTAILDWLVERGFEIGLHDYWHDNKLIYLREPELRRRLDKCRPFINRWNIRGFRSPSWFRTTALMRTLRDYVSYDCSCLDFDWLCPAGRGGVLTTNPFLLEDLVELPTTIPFEAPLLDGCHPGLIPMYWQPKVDWLLAVGGQAVVNTHPDPHYCGNSAMTRAYGRFLEDLLNRYKGRWCLPYMLAQEVERSA